MPELSWEVPRNASEIGIVTRQAILRQWAVPSISFDGDTETYDFSPRITTFIVSGWRKQYRVMIVEEDNA
jgi:hypothetical protein